MQNTAQINYTREKKSYVLFLDYMLNFARHFYLMMVYKILQQLKISSLSWFVNLLSLESINLLSDCTRNWCDCWQFVALSLLLRIVPPSNSSSNKSHVTHALCTIVSCIMSEWNQTAWPILDLKWYSNCPQENTRKLPSGKLQTLQNTIYI